LSKGTERPCYEAETPLAVENGVGKLAAPREGERLMPVRERESDARECANAEAGDAKHLTPGSPSGLIRSIVRSRLVVGKLKG